ncbi:MAG: glycosyltransferase family 4 protein [Candidatus Pacearchaeota archaeon]|nr:glycosyltransferase family 4 protein [Candidatus Pacearchaeota archaeon]
MKIAHITPLYFPVIGGVGKVAEELAKRQVLEGHEVHIFTSDYNLKGRIKKREEVLDGVRIHRCFHIARMANFNSLFPSVFFRLIKGKFDIIHSHNFGQPHFVFSGLSAKISGAKHIHTTHCPWSDAKRSLVGRIGVVLSYNIFSRFILSFTDKIIAITPWEVKFIKKFGGKEENIIILPNGMSKDFFKKIKNNDFRKKYKIPKKDKIVLFFGRLNPVKQPDMFVKIAKEILKERKDIFFVIRGPDEGMESKVREMIGTEKNILLLGKSDNFLEIIKMYQSSNIYVLPSYREGLPLTLFEAMASGLPIVASPVNGVPYEMKSPENGFFADKNSVKDFKKKILQILNNKKLNKIMKENNIKKAKKYSWDIINKKTLKIYNSLLKNK